MHVTIEICAGPNCTGIVTKSTIQKNIDALQRAIDGKPLAMDFVSLTDTKYILVEIQKHILRT